MKCQGLNKSANKSEELAQKGRFTVRRPHILSSVLAFNKSVCQAAFTSQSILLPTPLFNGALSYTFYYWVRYLITFKQIRISLVRLACNLLEAGEFCVSLVWDFAEYTLPVLRIRISIMLGSVPGPLGNFVIRVRIRRPIPLS